MYVSDTIVAIATPPGRGGIGVVRFSGPDSRRIAGGIFRSHRSGEWPPHRMRLGTLVDDAGHPLDEALAVYMPAPHSYTGEDVVELQAHGSPVVLRRVMALALAHGARLAAAGEFTQRAFLNGRLDLVQAEAVADLIDARGSRAAALAAGQLGGTVSQALAELREELISLKALLEVQIDFVEEEIDLGEGELYERATRLHQSLQRLAASHAAAKRARDGVRVALVGRPNVGKSSLLNALLGEERAIVSDLAGTTRDVIQESIELAGIPVVLSDTAGLRDAEAADAVERLGMQRTAGEIERAEVVVVVLDASHPCTDEDRRILEQTADTRRVLVLNKCDLPRRFELAALTEVDPSARVHLSARTHAGLDELRGVLTTAIEASEGTEPMALALSNERQTAAVRAAADKVERIAIGLREGTALDLLAVDADEAIEQIAAVTGTITSEDVLDRIFSRFCIGK